MSENESDIMTVIMMLLALLPSLLLIALLILLIHGAGKSCRSNLGEPNIRNYKASSLPNPGVLVF